MSKKFLIMSFIVIILSVLVSATTTKYWSKGVRGYSSIYDEGTMKRAGFQTDANQGQVTLSDKAGNSIAINGYLEKIQFKCLETTGSDKNGVTVTVKDSYGITQFTGDMNSTNNLYAFACSDISGNKYVGMAADGTIDVNWTGGDHNDIEIVVFWNSTADK